MLKKAIYNIIIASIITLLMLIINWLALPNSFSLNNLVYNNNLLAVFLISLLGTFFSSKKARIYYYFFLWFLMLMEYMHIAYYGNIIYAAEVWIFFTQFVEIASGIGGDTMMMFFKPFIIIMITYVVMLFVIKYQKHSLNTKYLKYIVLVFVILWPVSLYVNERNIGFSPPANQHIVRSGMESFFAFFGRIIPMNMSSNNTPVGKITPTPKPLNSDDVNVILVMGESLGVSHMSLYGYSKETTPRLQKLKNKGVINVKKAIAGAVNTYCSLSNFMNVIDTVTNQAQVLSQNTALFKLAKQNSFNTYFISAQSTSGVGSIFNIMAPKYVDIYKTAPDIVAGLDDATACLDIELLKQLNSLDLNKGKNFIILHQYGSHELYKNRYTSEFAKFKVEDYDNPKVAHYDNSVLYTDNLIAEVISLIKKKTTKPTYFIFTSDHGEEVGDNGVFGHNMLREGVVTVPVVTANINMPQTKDSVMSSLPYLINHNNLSSYIANKLGYDFEIKPKTFFQANGLDYLGTAGLMNITYNDSNIVKIERK